MSASFLLTNSYFATSVIFKVAFVPFMKRGGYRDINLANCAAVRFDTALKPGKRIFQHGRTFSRWIPSRNCRKCRSVIRRNISYKGCGLIGATKPRIRRHIRNLAVCVAARVIGGAGGADDASTRLADELRSKLSELAARV